MKRSNKMKLRTLADIALHASMLVDKHSTIPYRVDPNLRPLLLQARRFTLDSSASAFLADLVFVNYPFATMDGRKVIATLDGEHPAQERAIEMTRTLARLPHKICWFEYDNNAFGSRQQQHLTLREDVRSPRIGWLLRQHEKLETAFRATIIADWGDELTVAQQPFDVVWTTDDSVLPWQVVSHSAVDKPLFNILVGLRRNIGMTANGMFQFLSEDLTAASAPESTMVNNGIELRAILTLLATINDIPFGVRKVEPSHGYMARHRYQKFLDHTVITLNLPKGRDPHKLARDIIAISRRRAHQVRGHWRRDWRHEGNRVWVKEHQRGDASLGFVTHDYAVQHEQK